jgi:hypothetical protein
MRKEKFGVVKVNLQKSNRQNCKQWKLTRRNERKTKNALKSMGNAGF